MDSLSTEGLDVYMDFTPDSTADSALTDGGGRN
jgi:hypothetical protein